MSACQAGIAAAVGSSSSNSSAGPGSCCASCGSTPITDTVRCEAVCVYCGMIRETCRIPAVGDSRARERRMMRLAAALDCQLDCHGLAEPVRHDAFVLARRIVADDRGLRHGYSADTIAMACTHISCRQHGIRLGFHAMTRGRPVSTGTVRRAADAVSEKYGISYLSDLERVHSEAVRLAIRLGVCKADVLDAVRHNIHIMAQRGLLAGCNPRVAAALLVLLAGGASGDGRLRQHAVRSDVAARNAGVSAGAITALRRKCAGAGLYDTRRGCLT